LYDPTASTFYLRNSNDAGFANITFNYGPGNSGWTPIAGDWDGDARDTIGLYDPTGSAFYLRNSNDTGYANVTFGYGPASSGWKPIVGDWNGFTSPLLAAGGTAAASQNVPAISQTDLQPVIREAIARWTAAGLDAATLAKLAQVQFVIGDLPGAYLGEAEANRICIDRDAAGHGWFVDPTPAMNEEFVALPSELQQTAIDPRAVDRIDLLTVVEHELGHILGFGDLSALADNLMGGMLGVGARRNPSYQQPLRPKGGPKCDGEGALEQGRRPAYQRASRPTFTP
jgi:hypothetical protein